MAFFPSRAYTNGNESQTQQTPKCLAGGFLKRSSFRSACFPPRRSERGTSAPPHSKGTPPQPPLFGEKTITICERRQHSAGARRIPPRLSRFHRIHSIPSRCKKKAEHVATKFRNGLLTQRSIPIGAQLESLRERRVARFPGRSIYLGRPTYRKIVSTANRHTQNDEAQLRSVREEN